MPSVIVTGTSKGISLEAALADRDAESISKFPPTRTRFRCGSEGPDLIRCPRLSAMLATGELWAGQIHSLRNFLKSRLGVQIAQLRQHSDKTHLGIPFFPGLL
jgi:hypothetical protein